MTAPQERYVGALDAVGIALSEAVAKRTGGLGEDPLLVVEFVDGQTRVLIGGRQKMTKALLDDGFIDDRDVHFLSHRAPKTHVWVVIAWPGETSIVLHPLPPPPQADRRAS
jgi:hypothetical protein